MSGTNVLGAEVSVVVGPPADGVTVARPPVEGNTTGGTRTPESEDEGITGDVSGDERDTVGYPTAGGVTAGGLAIHPVAVAT